MSAATPPRRPFWRGLVQFDWRKANHWLALRNTVGIGAALAVGVALGRPNGGLMAAIGALDVAYSDGTDPYRHRARRMLSASLLVALAVVAGGLSGHNPAVKIAILATCAFGAGMMVAVNATATDIGNITAVTVIVFSSHPMTPADSFGSGLAALAGGLFQTVLALAMWAVRRYAPERRALAALYLELSRAAANAGERPSPPRDAPPASRQTTDVQNALAGLGGDRSVEAERYLALASQAERIRLALMTLTRLRIRTAREEGTTAEVQTLDHAMGEAARLLESLGRSLEAATRGKPHTEELAHLDQTARSLRTACTRDWPPELRATLADARSQLEGLAGQLRSAVELAGHATPQGLSEFERQQAERPRALRLTGAWATVRANLNLESGAFRHALRLAGCVAAAELAANAAGWPRGYWAAMTAAIVLRPDFATTFSRGVLRALGTLIGLGLATAVFHLLAPSLWWQVALLTALAYVLRAFGPANYGIFAASLTALVVLLLAIQGSAPGPVMVARAINTLAGAGIALAAYALWPTWERTMVPDALARLLEAYRAYFGAVSDGYYAAGQNSGPVAAALDRTRLAARLARFNLEASVARLHGEPGSTTDRVLRLDAILADSHRFIHAAMSLEAGLLSSRPVAARPAFRVFSEHVDLTLYYLAAALRGSAMSASDLPDLREDHHTLAESGDSHIERYALVNVETDRVTNSLNTLAGEVLDWARGQSA